MNLSASLSDNAPRRLTRTQLTAAVILQRRGVPLPPETLSQLRLNQPTAAARPAFEFRGAALEIQSLRLPEFVISGPSETGKTIAALHLCDTLARAHPGAQGALVRKVRADMDGTVLQLFRKHFVTPNSGVTVFGGEHCEFFDYDNGSRIWVGGMDRPGKVLSGARDFIYTNQAEELERQDWETMSTRTTGRAGVIVPGLLFGDCNPGGPDHWLLSRPNLKMLFSQHVDNPSLFLADGTITEQGVRTLTTLQALTGARRERLYGGKWVQEEGVVYGDFDAENITDEEPDSNYPVELSADDGFNDPRAILFIQKHPTYILVFDEIYESWRLAEHHVREVLRRMIVMVGQPVPEEFNRWTLEECALWCRTINPETKLPRVALPEICIGSPEAKEMQMRFKMADIQYRYITHRIKDRIDVVRRLILDATGTRTLRVHRRCRKFIGEMMGGYKYPDREGQRRNNENPADENNHACDSFGMWAYVRARRS